MNLFRWTSLALLTASTSVAQLLVLESTNDDVMMFDAFDGSLISMQFLDMNLSTGTAPATPQELVYAPNGDILISDQKTVGVIYRFSNDGTTYLGESTTPLNNVRGFEVAFGSVWVANAGTTGGAPGFALVQLDLNLGLVQAFPLTFSPWDVQAFTWNGVQGLLISDITTYDLVFFDPANPASTVIVHDSDGVTGIDFPQYIRPRASNGNLLVAGFSPPSGIYEYDPLTGAQLAYIDTVTLFSQGGLRGVHELGNGNLLVSSGAGVRVYDPVAGTLTPVVTGVSARAITRMESAGPGVSYCGPANSNTSGGPATLRSSGSATVASNNLTLIAANIPQNQFGFFLTSMTQGFVMNPGGSQGNLCLSGTIGRYVGPGQIRNAGAGGSFSLPLNLALTPAGSMFVSIAAGETWNFQAWFRDIGPSGSPESNFTDGLEVLFQ